MYFIKATLQNADCDSRAKRNINDFSGRYTELNYECVNLVSGLGCGVVL